MAATEIRERIRIPESVQARVEKLRARVEEVDAEGERLIRTAIERGRKRLSALPWPSVNGNGAAIPSVKDVVHRVENRYEASMSRVLGFFNIASTRDVDDLNKRITKLSRRIGALGRAKSAKGVA